MDSSSSAPITIDRLSSLHDSILTRILSLLPTNQIAKTCILSKRWLNLWTTVPSLNFEVSTPEDEDFVDRVIAHRPLGSDIKKFRLRYSPNFNSDPHQASKWILYALLHNVEKLDVDVGWQTEFSSLASVFRGRSLEYLALSATIGGPLNLSDSFSMNKLRFLKLETIVGIKSALLGKLVSSCPVLAELFLKGGFDVLEIRSSKLQKFTIQAHHFSEIKVYCPSLVAFDISTQQLEGCFHGDMPRLMSADIHMPFNNFESDDLAAQILKSVCNVQCLHFKPCEFKSTPRHLLPAESMYFPTFDQLKYLTFSSCLHVDDLECMIYLLRHLRTVNFLCIRQELHCFCASKKECWRSRKLNVKILNHLKEVVFIDIEGDPNVNRWEFLKFLSVNVGVWKGVSLKMR